VHQHAANTQKKTIRFAWAKVPTIPRILGTAPEGGGLTAKIHALVDTEGQAHDGKRARDMLDALVGGANPSGLPRPRQRRIARLNSIQ
jgi:hypothetical protein